ncbi:peptidase M24 [Caldalkalibacillus thermarum TA2.A1]|uniref:Peptidase M24 n=1 Tax=Caldalkalibacillus thermarum (strain TA2.A1) TaxID=986075 RepID=F5L4P6_CALTT|nr:Xaa-Pro peptidase family protein [Caldalkalibacillus thermarum]EGL83679.1 peptidase M24 [Caldalkalibacillus thermarum TA2.A1]QZT34069.1 Xaa-Pro peptidase family protein [Caldalkalibacillus thermarum TA2.A1]
MDTTTRVGKLRVLMEQEQLDGIVVFSAENRRYFSGFTGSSGAVVITATQALLLTDFRYAEQARSEAPSFEIIQHQGELAESAVACLRKLGLKQVGIEASLPAGVLRFLEQEMTESSFSFVDSIIMNLRKIKDEDEIDCIRQGIRLCELAFEHILHFIKPGLTERDIGLELEYVLKKNGADGIKANHVIASGERSALPHGQATDRVIREGEFVKMDIGAIVNGYYSDFTRTVVVGEPSPKQLELYQIVRQAQEAALAYIGPGKVCADVDEVGRSVIRQAGYGENFGHSLGHALGLEIHEKPVLRSTDQTPLEPGMVLTVEPGIYIPGWGGIRIEDVVVIREEGCENLTQTTKELQIMS